MRLTIIILAVAALTACNPLDPPIQLDTPVQVNIPEGEPCELDPGTGGCVTPATTLPPTSTVPGAPGPCDPMTGGIYDLSNDVCYPE